MVYQVNHIGNNKRYIGKNKLSSLHVRCYIGENYDATFRIIFP